MVNINPVITDIIRCRRASRSLNRWRVDRRIRIPERILNLVRNRRRRTHIIIIRIKTDRAIHVHRVHTLSNRHRRHQRATNRIDQPHQRRIQISTRQRRIIRKYRLGLCLIEHIRRHIIGCGRTSRLINGRRIRCRDRLTHRIRHLIRHRCGRTRKVLFRIKRDRAISIQRVHALSNRHFSHRVTVRIKQRNRSSSKRNTRMRRIVSKNILSLVLIERTRGRVIDRFRFRNHRRRQCRRHNLTILISNLIINRLRHRTRKRSSRSEHNLTVNNLIRAISSRQFRRRTIRCNLTSGQITQLHRCRIKR